MSATNSCNITEEVWAVLPPLNSLNPTNCKKNKKIPKWCLPVEFPRMLCGFDDICLRRLVFVAAEGKFCKFVAAEGIFRWKNSRRRQITLHRCIVGRGTCSRRRHMRIAAEGKICRNGQICHFASRSYWGRTPFQFCAEFSHLRQLRHVVAT